MACNRSVQSRAAEHVWTTSAEFHHLVSCWRTTCPSFGDVFLVYQPCETKREASRQETEPVIWLSRQPPETLSSQKPSSCLSKSCSLSRTRTWELGCSHCLFFSDTHVHLHPLGAPPERSRRSSLPSHPEDQTLAVPTLTGKTDAIKVGADARNTGGSTDELEASVRRDAGGGCARHGLNANCVNQKMQVCLVCDLMCVVRPRGVCGVLMQCVQCLVCDMLCATRASEFLKCENKKHHLPVHPVSRALVVWFSNRSCLVSFACFV